MKIQCPSCQQQGLVSTMAQSYTYADNEGYSAARMICPTCSTQFGVRLKHSAPPCKRCGFADESFIRHEGLLPASVKLSSEGEAAAREAEEVMRALRGY